MGRSLNDRPVAPGPAVEQGVAGEHAAEVLRRTGRPPRARDRACAATCRVVPPTSITWPSDRSASHSRSGWVSSHSGRSSGCSRIGAPVRSRSCRRDPHVVVVGVGAHDRLHPAVPHHVHDRLDVVRRVDDHALVVVADHPHVVVDVEGLAVEGEGPAGDGVVDPPGRAGRGSHRITTERSTSPWCIFSKAASTSSEADLLGHEGVEVEPALLVEVDQHREVAGGQAVAVPARLQRAAATEDVDQRDVGDPHVRGGYADQHHRAGQVAGVERLLPGLGAADGVDHDVGAVAVGERLDRPRPGRSRCC